VLFLLSLVFLATLLIVAVPIGKDYNARRKSLRFGCLLALSDLEIDSIEVRNPLPVVGQKFECLNHIVLKHGVKLIEELSILLHLRALYVSLRPANPLLLISGLLFYALKAMN
jgi:hypothetical protein